MSNLTHRERFVRTLTGQEVDRVPFIKLFGGTNAHLREWEDETPGISQRVDEWLQFEGPYRGWQIASVNMDLASLGPDTVLEDTPANRTVRRGDGEIRRWQKDGDYHTQVLHWAVGDRNDWERIKTRHLIADDPSRFPPDWENEVARLRARDYPLQLTHWGVYGFARKLMGDEVLAFAFYDDPDLVHDILDTYTSFALRTWERMTDVLDYDLIECWEDMAYRSGCLISPATFRRFLQPQYRRIRAFADAHRIPIVLVDSDGYIEPLTALMLESGVNALYPFEVQSGNDVAGMLHTHPDLGALGGLDKRVMSHGQPAIDAELERARALIRIGRFIPGPDHFVLSDVTYASYAYFMRGLRQVVLETQPGS
ncbi:MAG: hypothetical protein ACYCZF_01725 [Anaerolineae bacterium]